jgi:hypothetical protein
MPFSTIDKPNLYFNTILYTGDGASPRTLTGVGFQPDLVYIRNRDQAGSWAWYDAVRGTGASKNFSTDSANAEGSGGDATGYGFLSAFNTDGFSVTTGTVAYNIVNQSSIKYSAWNWLGANTTASNTSGTITSTVSANTTAGFSIVSYTGTGANATVGHGLGVAPSFIIFKTRNASYNWIVWTKAFATPTSQYLRLNLTDGVVSGNNPLNGTLPSSTVISLSSDNNVNESAKTYIAYCFAEIKGYSKFGSYIGNGSANGTFVYTGFKPAFILIKRDLNATNWLMYDNKRDPFNVMFRLLQPNTNSAEATADPTVTNIDFLSNGFKLPTTWTGINGSGSTYYYMCFAENPFVSSKGIPTTAR